MSIIKAHILIFCLSAPFLIYQDIIYYQQQAATNIIDRNLSMYGTLVDWQATVNPYEQPPLSPPTPSSTHAIHTDVEREVPSMPSTQASPSTAGVAAVPPLTQFQTIVSPPTIDAEEQTAAIDTIRISEHKSSSDEAPQHHRAQKSAKKSPPSPALSSHQPHSSAQRSSTPPSRPTNRSPRRTTRRSSSPHNQSMRPLTLSPSSSNMHQEPLPPQQIPSIQLQSSPLQSAIRQHNDNLQSKQMAQVEESIKQIIKQANSSLTPGQINDKYAEFIAKKIEEANKNEITGTAGRAKFMKNALKKVKHCWRATRKQNYKYKEHMQITDDDIQAFKK